MSIPENLARKIELFRSRGRIFRQDNELFNDTSWFAVFIGQNIWPRSYDPMVDVLPAEEVRKRLLQTRTAIRNSANVMPRHIDFIRARCAASPATFA
jgi:tryptophan halogenase